MQLNNQLYSSMNLISDFINITSNIFPHLSYICHTYKHVIHIYIYIYIYYILILIHYNDNLEKLMTKLDKSNKNQLKYKKVSRLICKYKLFIPQLHSIYE